VDEVSKHLRKWGFEKKHRLFVQGEKPKSRIIEEFKTAYQKGEQALILGTSSFWQGVDIPGQALSIVAIDKLPFPRPDDPVVWYLESENRKPFWEYSIPKAVITMKQGVGRLIRSETDFGVVIFFDPRIITKPWGKQFTAALPGGCFLEDGPLAESLETAAAFLDDMHESNQAAP
jgi:ATP-dependent DNA helicase DinG